MSFLVIGLAALIVSALTLFTGFGLGTLLLPAFALFFPVTVAVAATAVVHGANSVFKFLLLHRSADKRVVIRFGLPAVPAAFAGAAVLAGLSGMNALWTWSIAGREAMVTPVKLIMGALILIFALFDLLPALRRLRLDVRWLPWGGVLSGFFGGLSGHQGALRAAFLGRLHLDPAAFAATQAVIAFIVDAARLLVYGVAYYRGSMRGVETAGQWGLVATATVLAFAGAAAGKLLLPRITMGILRGLTGALLIVVALALATGIV